ncbi:hypothetical protein, partial [Staphylococcus pettenkoferi]|uniref:hypothetical protein n=1 Tax=Staphylococcus pettenkoferi TaxID=170573 RepID=UPI003B979752
KKKKKKKNSKIKKHLLPAQLQKDKLPIKLQQHPPPIRILPTNHNHQIQHIINQLIPNNKLQPQLPLNTPRNILLHHYPHQLIHQQTPNQQPI